MDESRFRKPPLSDSPNRSLGMMAKFWQAGRVKTRLARDIGDLAAAGIHKCFTLHLANQLATVASYQCTFVSPGDRCPDVRTLIPNCWTTVAQSEGDLGKRMQEAFKHLMSHGVSPGNVNAILIGADLPTLSAEELFRAYEVLEDHDVVLGPADDGGYYLIGLRGPWRADFEKLFESIPWSTSEVFRRTEEIIVSSGFSAAVLELREDIDTVESLQRLRNSPELDAHLLAQIESLLAVSRYF